MNLPVGLSTTHKYYGRLHVEKYKALSQTTSLLLIENEDNRYKIFNIQFIASCKVEQIDEEILMGFYLGEHNEFECYPLIDELPSDKFFHFSHFGTEKKFIIDYASYQKNCAMTGEPCWKLAEFIQYRETWDDNDSPTVNTFHLLDGKLQANGTNTL